MELLSEQHVQSALLKCCNELNIIVHDSYSIDELTEQIVTQIRSLKQRNHTLQGSHICVDYFNLKKDFEKKEEEFKNLRNKHCETLKDFVKCLERLNETEQRLNKI